MEARAALCRCGCFALHAGSVRACADVGPTGLLRASHVRAAQAPTTTWRERAPWPGWRRRVRPFRLLTRTRHAARYAPPGVPQQQYMAPPPAQSGRGYMVSGARPMGQQMGPAQVRLADQSRIGVCCCLTLTCVGSAAADEPGHVHDAAAWRAAHAAPGRHSRQRARHGHPGAGLRQRGRPTDDGAQRWRR